MNGECFDLSVRTQQTRAAAGACLARLADDALSAHCSTLSPRRAIRAIASALEQHDTTGEAAWVVRAARETAGDVETDVDATAAHRRVSAWPLWFGNETQRVEKPLLYLLRSPSVTGLRAALFEAAHHGVFCNDVEALASRWPRSVQPALPLWLSASPDGTPYDPASGAETLAILRAALRALYLDGERGFVYVSTHPDDDNSPPLSDADAQHAFRGMYRVAVHEGERTRSLRLLGAGKALSEVRRAAALLNEAWGVNCEVWSCPSYTRLAREAYEVERSNLFCAPTQTRTAHVLRCLSDSTAPVVAVTGYARSIASQIGAFVPGRFVALGAEPNPVGTATPDARWIAAVALKALMDDGVLPAGTTAVDVSRGRQSAVPD
ncbi:transketolase-like TK C-terminal-containing protein [Pandoraea pulmonicola]|uniref:Pyruvate dehydrogenase E1 component n=1 Tax=Pandoraea pulmonicola TaxID=93221 RepID=A0AAJ4Z988_PANPU|nr:hypothetical protein [Pandoraea pulmonicola]APD13429.1 hypothetical protein RO07_18365 [Pandoraea pulmonicola]SUA89082.1 Pyruvate dehydrogenase E1 component [Pandoraea pulmonicola]